MSALKPVVVFCVVFFVSDSQSEVTRGYTEQPITDSDLYTEGPPTAEASSLPPTDSPQWVTPGLDPRAASTAPPTPTATLPTISTTGCVCDITPDFCDIGCCCDVVNCGVAELSSVFSGCKAETRSEVCVESWLMFRANVDPELVTITDSLFCVRSGDEKETAPETLTALSEGPFPIYSPHFSQHEFTPYHGRNSSFYKADDIILTYYNITSVVSALRQPSPGAASSSCLDRNPAKFLRSGSLSCSRYVSVESCRRDSSLGVQAYVTGFSILRVPRLPKSPLSDLMMPVVLVSVPPEPTVRSGSCINAVSKVKFVITYTGAGEITGATVEVEVTGAGLNTRLLQSHAVQFQLATPSPTPLSLPLVGLTVGTPVIGWFGEAAQPLTVQGLPDGGACSVEVLNRVPILFAHNTITGCTYRSQSRDCTTLRSQLHRILQWDATPDMVAVTAGSQPDWSRVISEKCDAPSAEQCETGCLLPVSLSIQILWAQTGLLSLPQNHILGAKYRFGCQTVKCPFTSPLPITTEVIFSDATLLPEAPRGEPQPEWKFPFAFFTRGAGELDGE